MKFIIEGHPVVMAEIYANFDRQPILRCKNSPSNNKDDYDKFITFTFKSKDDEDDKRFNEAVRELYTIQGRECKIEIPTSPGEI